MHYFQSYLQIQLASIFYQGFIYRKYELSINGSFHFKSPRGGRGHGPDFVHIQYLITIRYTKTKSEVFGQVMT